jgi:hypothetical protein
VVKSHVLEGAVLEETVYPARVFDWHIEGAAFVCSVGNYIGLGLVFPRFEQLHVLWEPDGQTVIPATAWTELQEKYISLRAPVWTASGNASQSAPAWLELGTWIQTLVAELKP